MKKFTFFHLSFFLWVNSIFAGAAVTYGFSSGRFGDNLVSYLHAKWIAYYYQIPLIYAPFPYSSELRMDEEEFKEHQFGGFQNRIYLRDFAQPLGVLSSTLFICPYFYEIDSELKTDPFLYFKVDWKNREYRKIARDMISPKRPLQLTFPPDTLISVAVHVREGGGYDDEEYHLKDPLKMPPLSFYIDSLLKVLEYLKGNNIYCHIFTDARQPKNIVDRIQQKMPSDARIIFNYRENDNYHNAHVLEDFFSLFNFDILIRPQSNFSIIPSLLHDYAIVCSPIDFSINNQIVQIDQIKLAINKELYTKILAK